MINWGLVLDGAGPLVGIWGNWDKSVIGLSLGGLVLGVALAWKLFKRFTR